MKLPSAYLNNKFQHSVMALIYSLRKKRDEKELYRLPNAQRHLIFVFTSWQTKIVLVLSTITFCAKVKCQVVHIFLLYIFPKFKSYVKYPLLIFSLYFQTYFHMTANFDAWVILLPFVLIHRVLADDFNWKIKLKSFVLIIIFIIPLFEVDLFFVSS